MTGFRWSYLCSFPRFSRTRPAKIAFFAIVMLYRQLTSPQVSFSLVRGTFRSGDSPSMVQVKDDFKVAKIRGS